MSATDPDPAKRPLLFPDPVIEFYMEGIDRNAIREQLRKTPEERLEWVQKRADEEAKNSVAREEPPLWPREKKKIDWGVDPAWFAEAKSVPLLVPDPVIETYLEDVDRGLIRQALELSVPERFEKFLRLIEGAYALRRASREEQL
jgi:hypothetical protein